MLFDPEKMNTETIIRFQNVTKVYKLYQKPIDRLKETFHPLRKEYHRRHYALNDVSFDVGKGESLGLIGRNGSGKSTLLKLITGILVPNSGEISVRGRISALLELGTGFNMELTGLENICIYLTIMGFSPEEISARMDEIIDFADIDDFVGQPLKKYSSGMFARLAFAVAIHTDPDILIIDEVLAVGDTKFQKKCMDKMNEFKQKGTTILFVSHAPEQIKRFCDRAIWLENGKLLRLGESSEIVSDYEDSLYAFVEKAQVPLAKAVVDEHESLGRICEVSVLDKDIATFSRLRIKLKYELFVEDLKDFLVGIAIFDRERNYLFGPNTFLDKYQADCSRGVHEIVLTYPRVPLLSGAYSFDVGIFTDNSMVCIDYKRDIIRVNIKGNYIAEGVIYLDHYWEQ